MPPKGKSGCPGEVAVECEEGKKCAAPDFPEEICSSLEQSMDPHPHLPVPIRQSPEAKHVNSGYLLVGAH